MACKYKYMFILEMFVIGKEISLPQSFAHSKIVSENLKFSFLLCIIFIIPD